jgi:hypothetical protein
MEVSIISCCYKTEIVDTELAKKIVENKEK